MKISHHEFPSTVLWRALREPWGPQARNP